MNNLNQIEIQNIRHICGACTNICDKVSYYKTLTQDANVTDVLDEICTESKSLKTALSEIL